MIFTGGTIGSTREDRWISTDPNKNYTLIQQYQKQTCHRVDFTCLNPFTLLSEDMTGDSLRSLGQAVLDCIGSQCTTDPDTAYDGIIITHGSDTIQYSAAMLGYALGDLPLPVLLVCSNYVLEDPRANGLANFSAAVDFIASGSGNGVFVPYRNSDGIVYLHRGTRLLPHLPYQDDLHSIMGQYYGTMDSSGIFHANPNYTPGMTSFGCLTLPSAPVSPVLRLWPYPGFTYPTLKAPYPAAILLDTYHSGTLCSVTPGMDEFFRCAREHNIPVFVTGVSSGADYSSVKKWRDLSVIPLPSASPVAMYMKLWMLLDEEPHMPVAELSKKMRTTMQDDFLP